MEYYNHYIKERLNTIDDITIKEYLMNVTSVLITNKLRPCLFHRSKAEKYKLGPKTKKYVDLLETKVKSNYAKLIREDFKRSKKKDKKLEISALADFLMNCMTTLTLLKVNSNSHKSLLNFSKYIIRHFK